MLIGAPIGITLPLSLACSNRQDTATQGTLTVSGECVDVVPLPPSVSSKITGQSS
jgi:hypothetical protein